MLRRERLSVTGRESLGPYTLLRVERGDLDPGRPGQFFMLEAPGRLLPRPMSLCLAPPGELAFLIEPLGRGTRALCALSPAWRSTSWGRSATASTSMSLARCWSAEASVSRRCPTSRRRSEGRRRCSASEAGTTPKRPTLLPGADVVIDPVLVTEIIPLGHDDLRLRARADAPGNRADRARRAARVGGADGLRLRRVLRLRGRDRRPAETALRGGARAPAPNGGRV